MLAVAKVLAAMDMLLLTLSMHEYRPLIPDQISAPEAQARTSTSALARTKTTWNLWPFMVLLPAMVKMARGSVGSPAQMAAVALAPGAFAGKTDAEMQTIRANEQRRAAEIGQYSYVGQLGFTSAAIKDPATRGKLVDQLEQHLIYTQPEVLYTHNPADKHATHVAVFHAVVEALLRGFRPTLAQKRSTAVKFGVISTGLSRRIRSRLM